VPDSLGYRKRIGIIVPSTNTTVGPECELFRVPGVTCHTGRVTIKERSLNTEEAFSEHMTMMREGMRTAIDQIMTGGLDHVIIGIALESFWGGVAAADKLQAELGERAGVGVTMGSMAGVAALKRFGARRIAILTPHQPRGDEVVRAYMTEAGFEVVRLKGLACKSPRLIAQVPLADIRAALRELDGSDVDFGRARCGDWLARHVRRLGGDARDNRAAIEPAADTPGANSLRAETERLRDLAAPLLLRHLGIKTTWYLQSHFAWLRLSYSSIAKLPFVCVVAHVGSLRGGRPPEKSNFYIPVNVANAAS
jgi:maleate isomerase